MELGDVLARVKRVAATENAGADAAVFAEKEEALQAALASQAGVVLTTVALAAAVSDERVVAVADPRLEFAKLAKALEPVRVGFVHPAAAVDASAKIGARARIAAGAVVEADAVLGDDVTLGPGAKVLAGVVLGNRVVLQAGAVVGSTGFGYARDAKTGEYTLFPQQGALVIEDDVEIGANSTIDRGALGETRIGKGTKIDNLVHIGHNVRVGRNVVIAAQVGISGSCVIGDGAVLAGQVGISDHCSIGPGVILGGQAGVFRGATVKGPGEMFAGTPAEPIRNLMKSLARLRRLK
ncbi:MAG: UDP-3-O-(3-hydroxymyristoyl)glucosamine N-acyltransferase [Acidobacteriaceae bacterium]|nr:UDP-3-O-(3-hydroxymyristoyl)glucosamine N-acyltransferase [Acidobacteriaceae bacterium]